MVKRKQVSVLFYRNIDKSSKMYLMLSKLKDRYDNSHWIGGVSGFGVSDLSWEDGLALVGAIGKLLSLYAAEGAFNDVRIMFQDNQQPVAMKQVRAGAS